MTEPTQYGRYTVQEMVGRGAMGKVFRAYDPQINRQVAIKTIALTHLDDDLARATQLRFKQEAQLAGKLSHPNIVTIFDVGDDFIAMEFLQGMNLADFMKQNGPLSLEQTIRFVSQIASALDHAHSHGIIHRDVKPANIHMIDANTLKLTDFGIARTSEGGITATGQILGTPNYMAPEQVMGTSIDGRSDLFSLGVITYELLTGSLPFKGETLTTIAYNIVHTPTPPVRSANPSLPDWVEIVLQKALAKNPDDRFQKGQEFVEHLKSGPTQWRPDVRPPIPPMRKSKTKFRWVPLVVACLFMVGLATWFITSNLSKSPILKGKDQQVGSPNHTAISTETELELSEMALSSQNEPQNHDEDSPGHGAEEKQSINGPKQGPKKEELVSPNLQPTPAPKTKPVTGLVIPSNKHAILLDDLGSPTSIAIWNQRAWITDASSERVMVFHLGQHNVDFSFDVLDEPTFVLPEANFALLAIPGKGLVAYDHRGNLVTQFGKNGIVPLKGSIHSIAQGNLGYWVSITNKNLLVHIGKRGKKLREIKDISKPKGLLLLPNMILVVESGDNMVSALTYRGNRLWRLGGKGSKPGLLKEPTSIAVHGDLLAVAEEGNERISFFKLSDQSYLGHVNNDKTPIDEPVALVFKNGNLLVLDAGTEKLIELFP